MEVIDGGKAKAVAGDAPIDLAEIMFPRVGGRAEGYRHSGWATLRAHSACSSNNIFSGKVTFHIADCQRQLRRRSPSKGASFSRCPPAHPHAPSRVVSQPRTLRCLHLIDLGRLRKLVILPCLTSQSVSTLGTQVVAAPCSSAAVMHRSTAAPETRGCARAMDKHDVFSRPSLSHCFHTTADRGASNSSHDHIDMLTNQGTSKLLLPSRGSQDNYRAKR